MNDAPANGTCLLSISDDDDDDNYNGTIYALNTLVSVGCTGWEDDDWPLSYHFIIADGMLYSYRRIYTCALKFNEQP